MIEQILKKRVRTFLYGEIDAVIAQEGKVRVKLGSEGTVWVNTSLSLEVGDTVIMARGDSSRFVLLTSRKALPSQAVLLSL